MACDAQQRPSPRNSCTANATPEEKFNAWARHRPPTLRNPLYHWTHLELNPYFGITELLERKRPQTRFGSRPNAKLATPPYTTQGLLKKDACQSRSAPRMTR